LGSAAKTTLQGWKEIADYLHHDVRTVKRWEKQRQLPVRRMPGDGRSSVYIRIAEVEEWLDRSARPAATKPQNFAGIPDVPAAATEAPSAQPMQATQALQTTQTIQAMQTAQVGQAAQVGAGRRWSLPVAFAAVTFGTAATLFGVHAHRPRTVAAAPAQYVSKVPGVDELYLRGVYFYEQHTPASLAQARQYLQQAVARDAEDAPAWAALASTTLMLEQFEALPPAQGFDEAGNAASRALALDPSLADAHATLAFVDFFWSRDAVSAEREFQTALALDPNSATAHHRFGLMLLDQRRFPEALAEFDQALRLQPGSTSVVADRALALGFNGHRDAAVDILQSLAAQQPQNPIVYRSLVSLATLPPHNIPLFLASFRQLHGIEHGGGPPSWYSAAAGAYRSGGEPAMWQAIVAAEPTNCGSVLSAGALAQLGQSGAALDCLERGAQSPSDGVQGIGLDPLLDPLHGDPRFQYLIARIGLTPVA